ncbi:MAG: T9SS type A sorting domain-containing protein [Saprospiraceae bacterium]|nr:T9SS type A sorting domain-containing protein [Saprospiraceae bacterium]
MTISQNYAESAFSGIVFADQNETDCVVSYNDLLFDLTLPIVGATGISYLNARTGPQYLRGNDWFGDFDFGAKFSPVPNGFSYCDSHYHVSPDANVANGTNPVNQGGMDTCGTWFTLVEVPEGDFSCGGSTNVTSSLSMNEADLNLAGGGTLSLSPGYKWSSEMGLYRKFTGHPDLVAGDPVITGFLQMQQQQPVAVDTDPTAWASFASLSTETESLEYLLESYLAAVSTGLAQNAGAVQSANSSVTCSGLPCTAERYLFDLYLETQIIAPRLLTSTELEAVETIGLYCSAEAGNVVHLARAWYYMQTGEMLNYNCGNLVPEIAERNSLPTSVSEGSLLLTPNPADEGVQVTIPAQNSGGLIFLTDLWGHIVYQRAIPAETENATISTQGLPSGMYTLSFKGQTGGLSVQKLIIQH